MITIKYMGRAGNTAFQWMFARMLSKRTGMSIVTPPPQTFLHEVPIPIDGNSRFYGGETVLLHETDQDKDYLNMEHPLLPTEIKGYFQNPAYYNGNREEIRTWFDLPKIESFNYDDIVVNLRLQDYWQPAMKSVISPEWYFRILKTQKYDRVYVVVEPHPTNAKYLNLFRSVLGKKMVLCDYPPEQAFNFLRSFDRLVCSNSTFCWLAAFLGHASKVWMNKPWLNLKATPRLYNMVGATVVPCSFARDPQIERLDLIEYWTRKS